MPEAPEVQDSPVAVVSISMPHAVAADDVLKAGMVMEDARRREAHLADLQAQLRALAGTSAGEIIAKSKAGRSAQERERQVRAKLRELRQITKQYGDQWEGPCAPATVINLNPVELHLIGQLQRWSMPAAGNGGKVELGFRGRKFVGSYMTISTPEIWLAHTGVNTSPAGDTPLMEARYIPPIGIAHQFYSHYSIGADDAQQMGGILIFQGDIHTIEPHNLNKRKREVLVPKSTFSSDTKDWEYSVEPMSLESYLAAELDRQRSYAEQVISAGHQLASSNSEDRRNQLTQNHVLWHNYALEMRYIESPLPWAAKKLTDSPLNQAVFCPDCRARQEDALQYFCRECNAPFDAYKAFMAGKQVSPDRLAVYAENSQEFKDIVKELERRKRQLTLMGFGPEESKKAKKES